MNRYYPPNPSLVDSLMRNVNILCLICNYYLISFFRKTPVPLLILHFPC